MNYKVNHEYMKYCYPDYILKKYKNYINVNYTYVMRQQQFFSHYNSNKVFASYHIEISTKKTI